jgi:hypothetical protein
MDVALPGPLVCHTLARVFGKFLSFCGILVVSKGWGFRPGVWQHEENRGKRGGDVNGRHHAHRYAHAEGVVIQDTHINVCRRCCHDAAAGVGLFCHVNDVAGPAAE